MLKTIDYTIKGILWSVLIGGCSAQEPSASLPKCVIDTVWNEARGEDLAGQLAVLHTIHNRVVHKGYGNTFCEVVTRPHQFAYSNIPPQTKGYIDFRDTLISHYYSQSYDSTQAAKRIQGSLYFVSLANLSVDTIPKWYYTKEKVAQIGAHTFLK